MITFRTLASITIFVSWISHARGGNPHSFDIDVCAWEATHILVATEGPKIDGELEILESWKGDLKQGGVIQVPELAAFRTENMRMISDLNSGTNDRLPTSVSCSRMVIFLIQIRVDPSNDGKFPKTIWAPANPARKEMRMSVAWIESNKVFAFAEIFRPGPSELVSCNMGELEFKRRVEQVVAARSTLLKAIAQKDSAGQKSEILNLLRHDSEYVRESVVRILGTEGKSSLPILRQILKEQSLLQYHGDAIRALAKAGGTDTAAELYGLLRDDLEFWKKEGPGLRQGWWNGNGVDWNDVTRLRAKYSRAYAVLESLKTVRFTGGQETIAAFREFWQSLPQLDGIGRNQVGKACDELLSMTR